MAKRVPDKSSAFERVREIGDEIRDLEAKVNELKEQERQLRTQRTQLSAKVTSLREEQQPLLGEAEDEGHQRTEIGDAAAISQATLWRILGPKEDRRPMRRGNA